MTNLQQSQIHNRILQNKQRYLAEHCATHKTTVPPPMWEQRMLCHGKPKEFEPNGLVPHSRVEKELDKALKIGLTQRMLAWLDM